MGVSVGDVALLQMIQSITVLCMEIPTGVVADAVSRKLSVILSCLLLVIYYPIMCFGAPNMIVMGISQVLYALALCLISGSFEGWQTEIVKIEYPNQENKLNYYGHLKYEINSFITMFSGTIGSIIVYVFGDGYVVLFLLCTIIMIFLVYGFSKIPYGRVVVENEKKVTLESALNDYGKELQEGVRCCFSNIHGWCFFLGLSILGCTYQVVYYYWQPYFAILAKNNYGFSWMINNKELLVGVVFFIYCFSRFIMNRFVRRRLIEKMNPFMIAVWSLMIASICAVEMCFFRNVSIWIHIFLFAIIQGTILLVESVFESQFIKKTKNENISCSLSITSAATSIVCIVVLAVISKYITEETMRWFFLGTVPLYLLLIVVIVIWNLKYEKMLEK